MFPKDSDKINKNQNGWWVDDWRNNEYNYFRNKNRLQRGKQYKGKEPFVCNSCEKTWEKVNGERLVKYRFTYYDKGVIPTYKKTRKDCPKCEPNKSLKK